MAKVKIQGNASGTGVLTVTAPNTSTDRTITLPDATGTLATTADVPAGISSSADATAITIDSNENVGIGVTPKTWDSRKALQIGGNGTLAGSASAGAGGYLQLLQNAYTDGTWKYISTDEAARLRSQDGQWNFDVAASGSADSAISWATKVTIDNDGLKFGTDTAAVNALDDYETGTWTPSNQWISLTNHVTARYVKIGNVVMVWGNVQWASSPSDVSQTGGKIQGLPFTPLGGDHPWEGSWWINHTTGARKGITETDFYVNASTELIMYNRVNSRILQRQQVSGTHLKFQAIYQVA